MKTLIIGSSGKISKVFRNIYFNKKKYIFTTSKKKLVKKGTIYFDITKSDIIPILRKKNINKVIIFSAISNPEECKLKKKIKL